MTPSTEPLTPPPPGVGRTSIGVPRIRAGESRRPDRLFDDPFAQAFVDAAPGVLPALTEGDERTARLVRWVAFFTVIRTRFFDDHLAGAARLGGYTDLWKGGLGAQLPEHLRAAGWAVDVHDRSAVAAGYGRSGPPAAGAGFVVAARTAS